MHRTFVSVAFVIFLSLTASSVALGAATVELWGTRLDPARAAVVIPDAPTAQERTAAADLTNHLAKITGGRFSVVAEKSFTRAQGLYVGATRFAAKNGIDVAALGEENVRLKSVGKSLVLAGGKRGVLYAVSVFLEDSLGCRWFAPDCATMPTSGKIRVAKLDRTVAPAFEFRSVDYGMVRSDENVPKADRRAHAEYATHLRLNGYYNTKDEDLGGFFPIGKTHELTDTFFAAVPPKDYFKDHPEYYSLVAGERRAKQLCLTNPDVLRLATEWIEKRIADNPQSRVFSMAQEDGGGACQCDKCKALGEKTGGIAGPILAFVNAIAERVAKKHPDVRILTDAYYYSFNAPKNLKAHPNVIVCLATWGHRPMQPLEKVDPVFCDNLAAWAERCDNLYIYDYDTRFDNYMTMYANWFVRAPNIRLFKKHGVKGIFQQSCPYPQGELNALRAYLSGRLLWNPALDQDALVKEFCDAYYGAAGAYVVKYMKTVDDVLVRTKELPDDVFHAACAELERGASAVADDPVRLKRLNAVRLSALARKLALARNNARKGYVEKDGRIVSENPEVAAATERDVRLFARLAKELNITYMGEGGNDARVDGFLSSMPRALDLEIVRMTNEVLDVQILPGFGGRIYRMVHAPTGRELMFARRSFEFPPVVRPDEGGFAERIGPFQGAPGQYEPYKILKRTAGTLVVEGVTSDGVAKIRRAYRLDPKKPVLRVKTTVTSLKEGRGVFRLCGETVVPSHDDVQRLHLRQADGTWKPVGIKGLRPGTPGILKKDEIPNGAWALEIERKKGISIPVRDFGKKKVTWKGTPVDFVFVHQFERAKTQMLRWLWTGHMQLSVQGEDMTLNPGESFTFTQSFGVTTKEKLQRK